MFPESGGHLED